MAMHTPSVLDVATAPGLYLACSSSQRVVVLFSQIEIDTRAFLLTRAAVEDYHRATQELQKRCSTAGPPSNVTQALILIAIARKHPPTGTCPHRSDTRVRKCRDKTSLDLSQNSGIA